MAISLVHTDALTTYVPSDTSITIPIDGSVAAGDMIIVMYMAREATTTPSGYTKYEENITGGFGGRQGFFVRIADGTETSVVLQQAASNRLEGFHSIYRGAEDLTVSKTSSVDSGTLATAAPPDITEGKAFLAVSVLHNEYATSSTPAGVLAPGADAEYAILNTSTHATNDANRVSGAYALYSGADTTNIEWEFGYNNSRDGGAALLTVLESSGGTDAVPDNFDSAIGTASVTDPLTSTPTITITPDDQADRPEWLTVYIRVSGVDGKTPSFSLDFSNFITGNSVPANAEWGMVWRYVDDATVPADGRPRAWNEFDNNSGSVSHTFSMSAAFTADDIEVAVKPRWRYLDTQRAIDYVASTAHAFELDSSVAASGLPTHVHAQIEHTGTVQNSVTTTPLNLYCIGIDDTSVQPDGGEDKLNLIILPGQHSSEDQGNLSAWELVYFYTDGTGTIADWFRKHCRLYVYDANPAGRYYGKERWTEEDDGDEDPNRAWDDAGSQQINAVKTAIGTDISRTDVLWDFHGDYRLNGNGFTEEFGAFTYTAIDSTWLSRANTAISPRSVADLGAVSNESAQAYGYDALSAQLSLTLEMPVAAPNYPDMNAMYGYVAEAYADSLQQMVGAGEITLTEGDASAFNDTHIRRFWWAGGQPHV